MRKRTVKKGLRLIFASLLLILIVSFFHDTIAGLLSLSYRAEINFYRVGIFWGAAMGGYGVVTAVLGFILSANKNDSGVTILPTFLLIVAVISLFFYLLSESFNAPEDSPHERLRPGETITI